MLKKLGLICVSMLLITVVRAQTDTTKPVRIAVLAPLYIDSAFNGYTYKTGNAVPKHILPGLEFYHGIMMAVEQLQKEDISLEVFVYDTKSSKQPLATTLSTMKLLNLSMVIASFNNATEQKMAADFALDNSIPLISVTYPNDALLKTNPFFVLLNSTLKTHVEGIYKNVQKTYPTSNLVFVTRKGSMEDRIKMQFDATDPTRPLKYKTVEFADDIAADKLFSNLDTTTHNVIICGSLNESFAIELVKTVAIMGKDQDVTVVGMPTWDGIKELSRKEYDKVDIVYSTPFNIPKGSSTESYVYNAYKKKLHARPSDIVYKGYEVMFRFSKLLVKHKSNFLNNLSDPSFNIWTRYQIEPTKLSADSFVPDYQENKKLYFINK